MKEISATGKGLFRLLNLVFLVSLFTGLAQPSFAHKVERYNVSCFLQGETVTIHTQVSAIGYNSYIHWQYRTSPAGAWTYLSNGNNLINGRTFLVTGASQPTFIEDSIENLVIANVGSPAYTTQLDNVEFRVLMTDFGLDPQTNTGIPVYGGEEFGDRAAKTIRIRTRPAGENCYSACTNNMLVINPALVPPPITDYFGGFEVAGSGNFSAPGTNGVTAKAYTDMTQWTSGSAGSNPRYRVMNNPDSMNTSFSAFAPHSGMGMMVVNANNSCTNRVWYRTIAEPGANTYYQGTLIFRAWFSKISTGTSDPVVMLELKGGTTIAAPTTSYVSLGSVTQTVSGTPGTWTQLVLAVNIPVNSYQKLEISIKTPNACNGTAAYLAIDDLCLLEPVSGLLPIVTTPLQAAYTNGIARLSWSSLQEQNGHYYEIQKSADGVNFTALAKVEAQGNSESKVNYRFDDIQVSAGTNYYRLKQVDKDGSFLYSNIAALQVQVKGVHVTGIYPAPFTDKISVTLSSESAGRAGISLFDNTGKRLSGSEYRITKGVNTIRLTGLDNLSKGLYILKVQIGEEVTVKKLVK